MEEKSTNKEEKYYWFLSFIGRKNHQITFGNKVATTNISYLPIKETTKNLLEQEDCKKIVIMNFFSISKEAYDSFLN